MTTPFHLSPLQLAQLALRVHPEAVRVYPEAYTLMCTKTYRVGHDDTTDLPTVFWLDICTEDVNGHSRVVIPVTESRAMLPHACSGCAKTAPRSTVSDLTMKAPRRLPPV